MTMTYGPAFDEQLDGVRIRGQLKELIDLMLDGCWRTLGEITQETGIPEASASAQLRHAKKPRFGSYTLDKRRRHHGGTVWEYRLGPPIPNGQLVLL